MLDTSTPDRSEAMRQLVAQRKRAEGACEVCGTPVSGYATKRFCSIRCQVAAYRKRRRAEREAQRAAG